MSLVRKLLKIQGILQIFGTWKTFLVKLWNSDQIRSNSDKIRSYLHSSGVPRPNVGGHFPKRRLGLPAQPAPANSVLPQLSLLWSSFIFSSNVNIFNCDPAAFSCIFWFFLFSLPRFRSDRDSIKYQHESSRKLSTIDEFCWTIVNNHPNSWRTFAEILLSERCNGIN